VAVQARAWDAGLLDDLSDRAPRVAQMSCPFQFPWVDQDRPADTTTLRTRHRARVRSALHRVCPLHLTEQRQQHDRELRHRILRVARVDLDRVSEVPDTNLALGELVDQVQGVPDRPTETVERVHDDHVTLARVRGDVSEPGPVRRRAGLPVDVDPIARDPDLLERVDLPIEILLHRRHTRVPKLHTPRPYRMFRPNGRNGTAF